MSSFSFFKPSKPKTPLELIKAARYGLLALDSKTISGARPAEKGHRLGGIFRAMIANRLEEKRLRDVKTSSWSLVRDGGSLSFRLLGAQHACVHSELSFSGSGVKGSGAQGVATERRLLLNRFLGAQHACVHSEVSSSGSGVKGSEAQGIATERRLLLNRLLYRSKQRGYLELDLLLGKWTEENIQKLDDKHLNFLIEVLDLENPELWKWLTGQEAAPEHLSINPVFMAIHKQIMGALDTHAPPETRAKLGQSWVRGWDDNRKIGGPQVGNQ